FIVDVDIGQTLPCFREGPEDGLVVGIWSSCRVARASWQNSRRLFFATRSLLPRAVLEDAVAARVATFQLGADFLFQVVVLVLGFPIAAGQPEGVEQRSV